MNHDTLIRAENLERGMQPVGDKYEGYTVDRVIRHGNEIDVHFIEDDGETGFVVSTYVGICVKVRN